MKRTRRPSGTDFSLWFLPQRLVRWTSLCGCLALVLTSFTMFPSTLVSGEHTSTQGQGNQ